MQKLQLIKSANFGEVTCDIYEGGDEFFMTREQIGRALEYANPRDSIKTLHSRFKERLNTLGFSRRVQIDTPSGRQTATVYTRKGVMEICRHSEQPKADAFMDWVWDVMDGLITGRTKAVPAAELERIRIQAQADRSKAMLMNAQNRTLKTLMGTISDKKLSSIAVEVFGLKSIEEATGINMGQYLPECEKTFSATEIGMQLGGIKSAKIGALANKHGLKTKEYGIMVMDKSPYSSKEVPNFRYYANVVPVLRKILDESV